MQSNHFTHSRTVASLLVLFQIARGYRYEQRRGAVPPFSAPSPFLLAH